MSEAKIEDECTMTFFAEKFGEFLGFFGIPILILAFVVWGVKKSKK